MTLVPDGNRCYCGKRGCLDAYCAAGCLAEAAGGKTEEFFRRLDRGETEAAALWDRYASFLAMAVNNIHMVLDCDVVLGGYVGSCMGEYIRDVRKKAAERNTFGESGDFIKPCRHKTEAAALEAALKVMETFLEQV